MFWPMVSQQSVFMSDNHVGHMIKKKKNLHGSVGAHDQILLFSCSCVFVDVWHPGGRVRSLQCCFTSSSESYLGVNPAGHKTKF
jgi:hypothetical protein